MWFYQHLIHFSFWQAHYCVLVLHSNLLAVFWGVLLHGKVSLVLSPWRQIFWRVNCLFSPPHWWRIKNGAFRFAGDTCTALVQYQQDPHSSSLSSILPCEDLLSAKLILQDAKEGIYDLIDQVWNFQDIVGRLLLCAYISHEYFAIRTSAFQQIIIWQSISYPSCINALFTK